MALLRLFDEVWASSRGRRTSAWVVGHWHGQDRWPWSFPCRSPITARTYTRRAGNSAYSRWCATVLITTGRRAFCNLHACCESGVDASGTDGRSIWCGRIRRPLFSQTTIGRLLRIHPNAITPDRSVRTKALSRPLPVREYGKPCRPGINTQSQMGPQINLLWPAQTIMALASPAMGHWGTCPPRLPTVFFRSLQSRTNSDIQLHVVAYPVKITFLVSCPLAPNPGDATTQWGPVLGPQSHNVVLNFNSTRLHLRTIIMLPSYRWHYATFVSTQEAVTGCLA